MSAREFVQALRNVVAKGGAVLPSQALALYRTAAEQGGAMGRPGPPFPIATFDYRGVFQTVDATSRSIPIFFLIISF